MARAAVQALGHVVLTLSSTAGLIEELLALLGCGDANVVSEVRSTSRTATPVKYYFADISVPPHSQFFICFVQHDTHRIKISHQDFIKF